MDAAAVISVTAAVTSLTQLVKWSNLVSDRKGPILIMVFSVFGVALWVYSKGLYDRTLLFDFFAGTVAVMLSTAGVFGFTRSAPAAVTDGSRNSMLPGAGQSPTEKPVDKQEERRDR